MEKEKTLSPSFNPVLGMFKLQSDVIAGKTLGV
jgi:hypothetical protein